MYYKERKALGEGGGVKEKSEKSINIQRTETEVFFFFFYNNFIFLIYWFLVHFRTKKFFAGEGQKNFSWGGGHHFSDFRFVPPLFAGKLNYRYRAQTKNVENFKIVNIENL